MSTFAVLLIVAMAVVVINPNEFRLKTKNMEAWVARTTGQIADVGGEVLQAPQEEIREVFESDTAHVVDEASVTVMDAIEADAEVESSAGQGSKVAEEIRKRLDRLSEAAEPRRRNAIERLIADAAEWGWLMSTLGFQTPPRPQIVWRDDKPYITHGVGDTARPRGSELAGTAGDGH
jgi:hypothetical protein